VGLACAKSVFLGQNGIGDFAGFCSIIFSFLRPSMEADL